MEALFDRFAQFGFCAAILLRVAELFTLNPVIVMWLAAIAVTASGAYLLYRISRAEGLLETLIPGVVTAVGISALTAA